MAAPTLMHEACVLLIHIYLQHINAAGRTAASAPGIVSSQFANVKQGNARARRCVYLGCSECLQTCGVNVTWC